MKVSYFSHTTINPSETFIYDLFIGLKEKNPEITFFSGKSSGKSILSDVVYTGYAEEGLNLSFLAYKFGQIQRGNGLRYKNALQNKFSYKALRKHVIDLPDVAYIDYATSATLLVDFLSEHKIPFIVHVHGYDITSATNDPIYLINALEVFRKAQFVIAASHYIRKLLIMLGCPEAKIRVIRYGINVKEIKPSSWEERRKGSPNVIFLGRLTAKKNPIALLHAFKIVKEKVPQSKLTIIGDGEQKEVVQNRIKNLGLNSSVNLLGVLGREKSFPILNQHWVYAQHSVTAPSGDQEGFAISLAEAAAHELPVVSTLHNGIPENVLDRETGYLVNEFDYEAMGEKIIELLKNPELAEAMGKAGRIHIEQMCEPQKRIDDVLGLLKLACYSSSKKDS